MEVYHNSYHNRHLYLRINEAEADTLQNAAFDALMAEHKNPCKSLCPPPLPGWWKPCSAAALF